uniref:FAR1 domain-containing protein n=1 Tax=Oryza punctata TaxID=4537 RepID=A0A0E0KQJ3_ORYPU
MSSSAEPPPPEQPPTPAPALASPPPQPAASGNEAAAPPKPNPPITPTPARNASAAAPSGSLATAAPVPSRKPPGATSVAAVAAPWKASGVAATGVLLRKPPGTTAPVAARNIPATTAASRSATRATTTTAVSRRPAAAAAAAAVASRIPLRAAAAATTTAASRNPLTGAAAATATATATVAAVGSGGFRAAPTRPEEYTPRMGMEFESEHEAYEFYRYYGWKVGFNVRKEYANKSKKTGEITSRKFACSREGYRANVKRGNHMVPMPDSRTGCNAHLVIRRKKPGAKLEVYAFQPRHNHPLFATSCMPNPLQPNVVHWTTLPDAVTPPDLLMDGGEEFKACINLYEEETEFLTSWDAMIKNIMDKSSGTTAKESKKKGQKNKIQSRNCIEKGLRKKQKFHSEQPAEYALLDGSQSGNMFQVFFANFFSQIAFEGPPNTSPLGTQTPTYKTYRGIDLSSPMGPISYDEMHSGLDPTFTTHLGFATYHTSQVSSSSPHNQLAGNASRCNHNLTYVIPPSLFVFHYPREVDLCTGLPGLSG